MKIMSVTLAVVAEWSKSLIVALRSQVRTEYLKIGTSSLCVLIPLHMRHRIDDAVAVVLPPTVHSGFKYGQD